MADDLVQQVGSAAGTAGTGGMVGAVITFLGAMRLFAKPDDVEKVRLENQAALMSLKAEMADKYITKEHLDRIFEPMRDDLHYLRTRIDELLQRKP